MVAMAQPGPGQHQVWQGWPWKGRKRAERGKHPLAPNDHGTCWLCAPVPALDSALRCQLIVLPIGAIPTAQRTIRPLGQGCPLMGGPVWIAAWPARLQHLPLGSPSAAVTPGRRRHVQLAPFPWHPSFWPHSASGRSPAWLSSQTQMSRGHPPRGGKHLRRDQGGVPVGADTPKPNLQAG